MATRGGPMARAALPHEDPGREEGAGRAREQHVAPFRSALAGNNGAPELE